MPKRRYKAVNWKQNKCGRPLRFSDLAILVISTTLMVKRVFSMRLMLMVSGKWKSKKPGSDGKRRVWHKLHIAVDTSTQEIVAAHTARRAS